MLVVCLGIFGIGGQLKIGVYCLAHGAPAFTDRLECIVA